MDDAQWMRLMNSNFSTTDEFVNQLKHRQTFIKFKSNGRSYSRIFFLTLSEDAIHYQGSRHKSEQTACAIRDIDQIRSGFTTVIWKKCLEKHKISKDKEHLAFSILYDNNRHSLDLLAEDENIRSMWVQGLEYLIARYNSHLRTHHEITEQWIWKLFARADRDNSGYLTRNEARQLLFTLNIVLDDHDFNTYFNHANNRRNNYEEMISLDKDEFLIFYKFISYRPELVQIICHFNGSTSTQTAALLSDYQIINQIAHKNPVEHPHDKSSVSFKKTANESFWLNCRSRKATSIIQETSPVSSDRNEKKNYLSIEQLKDFLQNEQNMTSVSIEDCSKLIKMFEPSSEGQKYEELSIDGLRLLLLHDEFCIMNPEKSSRVYQDMTRPLTDYFIATSHNTYIRDNQVYGDCTPETYIHALRTGCRAVEMDCYDGDHMEPIVYHGNTLTKSIKFREIMEAIETQAFRASPYPLFLNIENHCSYEQQGVMARILKDVFKDHLLSKPLKEDFQTLPSPEELKYKVIIRCRRYPKGKTPADPKSDRSNDEIESNPKSYHPDFSNLIIYAQIASFTNITHSLVTQKCFHSISFKESKADDIIKSPSPQHLELIQLTNQHLIRIYPGAKRQDSSNINPTLYWIYGVQMVALNYQANDEPMRLQHGFFSDNGGCGYVLKPSFLLSNEILFDPKEKTKKWKHIKIHIISGQHIPKENNSIDDTDISDPYVIVSTFGIPVDTTEHRTPSVRNNGLNPIWDHKINVDIHCPELCLILFEVRDEDRYGRSRFLAQACLPFNAIQLGYRHIKLKSKNGDFIHGTLFVHIKIEDF